MKKVFLFILFTVLLFTNSITQAQETPSDEADIFDLSLEDLLNIEIVSASKKSESIFDAPVSSYTISREEIENSGATTIQEALRLCPGLIIREQNNGNYYEFIRGFDNIPRYSITPLQINNLTLVMIDNRPIFNYNQGGAYWEAIPIDITDIDRIEIVKGTSSALYGPNAVTGVINIITQKPESKGTYARATVQNGGGNSAMASLSVGHKFSNKFDFGLSANYQRRERNQTEFYDIFSDKYVENIYQLNDFFSPGTSFTIPPKEVLEKMIPNYPYDEDPNNLVVQYPLELLSLIDGSYPDAVKRAYWDPKFPEPQLSLERMGFNGFFNYNPNEKISLTAQVGSQASVSQRAYLIMPTSTSFVAHSAQYVNLNAVVDKLRVRASGTFGFEAMQYGYPANKLKYQTYDVDADYTIAVGKKISLRPGLNYQLSKYSDIEFTLDQGLVGLINSDNVEISSYAASLRIDYSPIENLRLIGGFRADLYSVPANLYPSFSFATTYKIGDALIRLNIGRAYSGSFIGPSFLNFKNLSPMDPSNIIYQNGIQNLGAYWKGNTDIPPFYMDMAEVGFRYNLTEKAYLDFAVFHQIGNNFKAMVKQPLEYDTTTLSLALPRQYENLDVVASQTGAELSLNFVLNEKIQIKPFINAQVTSVTDFNPYLTSPEVTPNLTEGGTRTTDVKVDQEHKSTPNVFGGFYSSYKPNSKLTFGLTGYFVTEHTLYNEADGIKDYYSEQSVQEFAALGITSPLLTRNSTAGKKDAKLLLNLNVNYALKKSISVFVTGRNLLNMDQPESYGGDRTPFSVLGGLRFNFSGN